MDLYNEGCIKPGPCTKTSFGSVVTESNVVLPVWLCPWLGMPPVHGPYGK